VALLGVKVAAVPLVFVYSADVPFTVPKALLSHGLAYALAGVLVGLFISFGRSFFVRSALHVPVLAFLVANVAASIFAADSLLALHGTHVRMLGLGTIADWVLLYFAVVLLVRTRADTTAVVTSALLAGLLVVVYEAVQFVGGDPYSWTLASSTRPFSTLGQPTILAQYLTTLALGTLALGICAEGLNIRWRAVLVLTSGILLLGTMATGTRSAVVGVAVGCALIVLANWVTHTSRRGRALGLVAMISATVVLAALVIASPLGPRLASTIQDPAGLENDEDLLARLEPAAEGRLSLYAIAAQMVRERPMLGYGPDNFVVGVPRYRTENEASEIRQSLATSPHSWLLYVATGSGLLGLGAFLAICLAAFVMTLRSGFRPTAIVGIAMVGAFLGTGLTTVSDIGTDWMFWVGAGAVAAATARREDVSSSMPLRKAFRRPPRALNRGSGSHVRSAGALLCTLLGLGLAAGSARAFEASLAARQSQVSRLIGRLPVAIEQGLRATRSDPRRAEYWRDLGLAYVAAGRWLDSSLAFSQATDLAPHDVRYVGDLARAQLILAEKGEHAARARAVELGERAIRIDPNNPRAQLTKAVVMQATGNLPEALRAVDRALVLDHGSRNGSLYLTAVQIKSALGQPADAATVARAGIAVFGRAPSTHTLRVELARALVTMGQPLEALNELEIALAILPGEPTAETLRAQIRAGLTR
jgi:O-antigen ligase